MQVSRTSARVWACSAYKHKLESPLHANCSVEATRKTNARRREFACNLLSISCGARWWLLPGDERRG
jgi:hypothetical protein